jgi:small subunit ribosomal protein S7
MKSNFNLTVPNSKFYLVKSFVGSITKNGKKTKSIRIFNHFLFNIRLKFEGNPLDILDFIIDSVRPKVFLLPKKIAGSTVRIPAPITVNRSYSMAVKWFLNSSKKRSGESFDRLIMDELLDIYINPMNTTLKKRDEYHKLAKLNRPYLRYNKFLFYKL